MYVCIDLFIPGERIGVDRVVEGGVAVLDVRHFPEEGAVDELVGGVDGAIRI